MRRSIARTNCWGNYRIFDGQSPLPPKYDPEWLAAAAEQFMNLLQKDVRETAAAVVVSNHHEWRVSQVSPRLKERPWRQKSITAILSASSETADDVDTSQTSCVTNYFS